MAHSSRVIDYLGRGNFADMPDPTTFDIWPGALAIYFAEDTGALYTFDAATPIWDLFVAPPSPVNIVDSLDYDNGTPAADGQVIAWDDADGKFKPVDQTGGGGGGGTIPVGLHRYWRFANLASQSGDPFTTASEFRLRSTMGGADLTPSSSYASGSYSSPPSVLYDGDPATWWGYTGPPTVTFDMGVAVAVAEVAITATDGRSPAHFLCLYSDDDTVYTSIGTFVVPPVSTGLTVETEVPLTVPGLSPAGVQINNTDSDFGIASGTTLQTILSTAVLTADRTVTMADAMAGAKFRFVRTGSDAFNLKIGALKNLATSTWCDIEWNATASVWILTAYGSL